jgi:predicted RND superfamily exporter protein
MKRQFHYIFFACTIALTVICGILMTRVNVNADMTKYLPDDSQMKRGLDIVSSVFGDAAQVSGSDVHIMFDSISPAEISGMCTLLKAYPDVNDVTYRYSADSAHTVFDLAVPKTINQKALGKQIAKRFGGNCVVETSQDGATPPISVMIIAAVLVMIVLFLMAQSWFEPVVILLTMGIAVVLNMGTNALLPSVSITTNFIGSILQAVLSLDYCIILLNRYRQEQNEHTDRQTAVFAANRAVKKAAPSVLSSALTTIVGLLMLCFMRLKIGADMGIVLAKGVACSLICTFTVMPSLMLLFRRVINKTAKPVYVPSTDKLARFVTSHKIPMMIGAVMLFFASWYFSQRTTIFFSANAGSKIEEVFPSPNPMLVIYDTQDEASIPALADSLMALPSVQTIISYPTLLGQQLTPAEMTHHISSLATLMADQMPEGVSLASPEVKAILTPEMMQIAYFMRATHGQEQKMTFPDLARFMHSHISSNPLFASYLDDDMRKQIALLQSMLDMPAAPSEPTEPIVSASAEQSLNANSLNPNSLNANSLNDTSHIQHQTSDTLHQTPDTTPFPLGEGRGEASDIQHPTSPTIPLVPFIEQLNIDHTSSLTIEMRKLTDTTAIRLPMSVDEMAFFIGSTPTQTRLVYGYAPGKKKLTPLQYVHLLTDDLFNRPGLQGLISPEQRNKLTLRTQLMDLANANASLSPAEMNTLLGSFGMDGFSEDQLLAMLAEPASSESVEPIVSASAEQSLNANSLNPNSLNDNSLNPNSLNANSLNPNSLNDTSNIQHPTPADLQAELFIELVFGGKEYTPAQMASKLSRLMKLSGVKSAPVTADQMSLLYTYYGSVHSACDTMRLGLDQLLTYVCDTLIYDTRLADMVPDSAREQVAGVKEQVIGGMGQLRQPSHSLFVVLTSLPVESAQTYAFVDTLMSKADAQLVHEHYYLGESVMYSEMKAGFGHEMNVVTLLTVLAIFLIVALTFRSLIVPTILVVTVMTAFYVNVVMAGLISGQVLYLAYLIVQAILMGATIDYGILFANYYRENRKTMPQYEAVSAAYRGSIRTILTSGIIMVIAPGVMAALIDDLMISNIVRSLAIGAFMAVLLILTVVPAVLVALDRLVVYGKKNRFSAPAEEFETEEVVGSEKSEEKASSTEVSKSATK